MEEIFDGSFTQQESISEIAISAALRVLRSGRLHRYNVIEGEGLPLSIREDRIKLTPGGSDKVTGVEFLGSVVRLKVISDRGPLTVVQSDMEFTKSKLDLGDQVKASWLKKDQLQLEA